MIVDVLVDTEMDSERSGRVERSSNRWVRVELIFV